MSSGKWVNHEYSLEYTARHIRVRRDRGPANAHLCACGNQAHDWATVRDMDDEYVPMCRSCHRHYDGLAGVHHDRQACKNGHDYETAGSYLNKAGVRICRQCDREKTARRRERLVTVS